MATWDWGQTQTRRSDHRSPGPAGVHDTIAARLSRDAGGDAAGKAYSISGSNLNKLNSHCSRNHRRFVIAEQNVLTFMSQTQVHNIFAKISFCRIELATRYTMYIMHICLYTICTVIWLICSSGTCSRRENLLKLLGTCQRQRDGLSLSISCWRASMATWSALLDGAADPLEIVLGSWAAAKIYPGPQVVRQPTRMRIPLSPEHVLPFSCPSSWFIFHPIRILFIRFSARTHKVWVSYLVFGLLKLIKNVLVCSNETPQIEF